MKADEGRGFLNRRLSRVEARTVLGMPKMAFEGVKECTSPLLDVVLVMRNGTARHYYEISSMEVVTNNSTHDHPGRQLRFVSRDGDFCYTATKDISIMEVGLVGYSKDGT